MQILFVMLLITLGWSQSDSTWETIFNGQDLTGWTPVFQGYAVGENPGNIFRVENGEMVVTYEGLNNDVSSAQLGNIWYEKEYSYYILSMEYQIWGNMASGSVGWGRENSGIMLHTQSAASMAKDQNFPLSLEMQIVGPNTSGIGGNPKKTGNLCTLGNDVIFKGQSNYSGTHCTAASENAAPLDTWVRAGALVLGDSVVQHIIDGKVAIEYNKPKIIDENMINGDTAAIVSNFESPLDRGYIALQSEGHPFKFRNIKVLSLIGCMDANAINYKDYYVKGDPNSCIAPVPGCTDSTASNFNPNANVDDNSCILSVSLKLSEKDFKLTTFLNRVIINPNNIDLNLDIYLMNGNKIQSLQNIQSEFIYESRGPGIYFFKFQAQGKTAIRKITLF